MTFKIMLVAQQHAYLISRDNPVPICRRWQSKGPHATDLLQQPRACSSRDLQQQSDVVLGQTSQSVSYRPRYDACRNLGVGLEMVTTLALVVYTCIMGIEPPTKS